MNTHDSNEHTVIVTGGASGIGLAVAKRLASAGQRVVLAGRDSERGARVARELSDLGAEVRFIRTDVRIEKEVESLVDETQRLFGSIEAVFNNAGVEGTVGPMMAWSEADIDATIDTNLKGAFYVMKHAARVMAAQGHGMIVNCASVLGLVPVPIAGVYAASKAALLHLTRCAAGELSEQGVRVLAVCPTVVDTPMMDRVSQLAGAPKAGLAQMVCPSGQVGSVDTIAGHIFDLITGTTALASGDAVVLTQTGTRSVQPGAVAG